MEVRSAYFLQVLTASPYTVSILIELILFKVLDGSKSALTDRSLPRRFAVQHLRSLRQDVDGLFLWYRFAASIEASNFFT